MLLYVFLQYFKIIQLAKDNIIKATTDMYTKKKYPHVVTTVYIV